ncbi:19220_t:CDS:2 [Racocetra fulgida]|uniref:19220_t:CDS:1 n=1 Tax=Racocetra fulgida TaxID=60492 RepID=A0A9N8YTM7_9GLOM|nr:19220_t:CDS:2 [Racocetra fulgida]
MSDHKLTITETKYLRILARKHILLPTKFKKPLVTKERIKDSRFVETNKDPIGELHSKGRFVVGIGSIHEKGTRYTLKGRAIEFDLNLEHQQVEYKNLYLLRGKEPIKANRFTFFKFLQQIKKEMNLPINIELAPHTLRRCFATYQAISGMPLPVLQKVLGHNNLATTSYYIRAGDLDNLVKFRPV